MFKKGGCFIALWMMSCAFASTPNEEFNRIINKQDGIYQQSAEVFKTFNPSQSIPGFSNNPKEQHYYVDGKSENASKMEEDGIHSLNDKTVMNPIMGAINHRVDVNMNSDAMKKLITISEHADEVVKGVTNQYVDCQSKSICQTQTENKQCIAPAISQAQSCKKDLVILARKGNDRIMDISVHLVGGFWSSRATTSIDLTTGAFKLIQGYLTSVRVYPKMQPLGCDRLSIQLLSAVDRFGKPVKVAINQMPTCENHYVANVTASSAGRIFDRTLDVTLVFRFTIQFPDEIKESIQDHCQILDLLKSNQVCQVQGSPICTSGAGRKIINGVVIDRPCWQWTQNYICQTQSNNTCSNLNLEHCDLVSTTCSKQVGDVCVEKKNVYQCPTKVCQNTASVYCGNGQTFCLDGNCTNHDYQPYTKFNEAVSNLSSVNAASKNFDTSEGFIFRGHDLSCRYDEAGFRNCCNNSGWGQDMGLAHCSQEEKELGLSKQKKMVIYVGSFCSKKAGGLCLAHKKAYCIFDSKLSRLIQEQGRQRQLGIGFGDGKHPDCRGLTPQELQHLNFDVMNFSEIYDDIRSKMTIHDQGDIQAEIKKSIDRLIQGGNAHE